MNKYLIAIEFENFLNGYLEKLKEALGMFEAEVEKAPRGSLKIVCKKSCTQFYYRKSPEDKEGKYIPKKERGLVKKLAGKKYAEKSLVWLRKQVQLVEKILADNCEKELLQVYEILPIAARVYVEPVLISPDLLAQKWLSVEYERLPFDRTETQFFTSRDEQMRSKSEIMIAEALYNAGVPYRYEFPLNIKGRGSFHPDFLCLNKRTGQEVIWEHFGLMDKPEYAANVMGKIAVYAQNGYVLGRNFIYTMESTAMPLNSKLVKLLIETHLV